MHRIAVLCTGNICRSPMAEYLLKSLAPPLWGLEFCSFGIMTSDGQEASSNASIVAIQEGIDLSPHRSRAVRGSELRECDLILTMTKSQKTHIKLAMPDVSDRTFTISEFGRVKGKAKDVEDPMGGDLSVYRKCFAELRREVERILPAIRDHFGLQ